MTPQDEMKALAEKWKDKNPAFMSREYIDMRFDRIRYIKLKKQYGVQHRAGASSLRSTGTMDSYQFAKEIFEEETKSQPS